MRRLAKGLSAFTPGRSGSAVALVLGLACAFSLVNATGAFAAKYVDSLLGTPSGSPALGGTFANSPRDVAVNDPSVNDGNAAANGDTYIVDDANHRIQRLNADGSFDLLWGADVIQTGKPGNLAGTNPFEICTVAADCKIGIATPGNGATSGNGSLDNPQGIAVDQDTGAVYVSDRDNRRINQYTADGVFVRSFGFDVNATTPALTYEVCPATDVCKIGLGVNNASASSPGPNAGQYSAGTTANGYRLDVSKPDGNPATGKLYLANTGSQRIEVFDLDGTAPTNIGTTAQFTSSSGLLGVAVDSAGILYAIGGGTGNPIVRYSTSSSSFLAALNVQALTGNTTARSGLKVDGATGNLFLATNSATVGIVEIGAPGSATPSLVGTYPTSAAGVTFTPNGLGVNPDTGKVFVPTSATSGALQARTVVYDDDGLGPINVTLQAATAIGSTTATVNATINPAPNGPTGQPTTYRFELSKNGITWTPVGTDTQVPPNGDTNANTPVSANLTGLEANTLYRFRVVATRANNTGAATSGELFFTTEPAAPISITDGASRVDETSAQLNGRVNPGGLATTYWFEWGLTSGYGNVVPVPAASAGTASVLIGVAEQLSGLEPATAYHFRLCSQNSLALTPVCGSDREFLTRSTVAAPDGRSYEMVTDPDKALRQGHAGVGGANLPDSSRGQYALPSTDGESVRWGLFPGATSAEAGHGFTWAITYEVYDRKSTHWKPSAVFNVAPPTGGANAYPDTSGISADLQTSTFYLQTPMFDNFGGEGTSVGSNQALKVMGDSGGPRGAGWYPWFDPAWYTGIVGGQKWITRIDDEGERLVAASSHNEFFLTLAPADGGGTPAALTPPQTGGRSLFLATAEGEWRPGDLINECTGTIAGADQTLLQTRVGTGVATDTIGVRDCEVGSPTSPQGATLSPPSSSHLHGSAITSLSDDGSRVFFLSPDLQQEGNSPTHASAMNCATAAGSGTRCPPQLFVRQYADDGTPTVRWISRAEDAMFNAPQQIGLLGNGVAFEGASRDGSVVYFRTNAPLTTDDPNGAGVAPPPGGVVAGTASSSSWDLYRYEIGTDNDSDPAAGDPGDRLTRISGGPSGEADPNTNCHVVATSGADAGKCSGSVNGTSPNGNGAVVRYMSDDGSRVYFVTTAEIPGAMNAPPLHGATAPTASTAQVNATSRNLYLFDASKSGAAAYEFVARLPVGPGSSLDFNSCASKAATQAGPPVSVASGASEVKLSGEPNCVHGTSSGDAIAFMTGGQLTDDDVDTAVDIYLYEAGSDRLTRVSAPRPGVSSPYGCLKNNFTSPASARCNGDFGFSNSSTGLSSDNTGLTGLRHWNIAENPDGSLKAVYFQSRLALVPEDVNGAGEPADTFGEGVMDVYEWRNGELSLVSPGTTQNSAFYNGNSLDGKHVFFWTEQRISPWEIDRADGDVYNATTATPFPDPPPTPPVCDVLGGTCQTPPPAPPPARGASSAALSGQGNFVPKPKPRCAKGKVRKGGKCVKSKGKKSKQKKRDNSNKRRAGK